MSQIPTENEGSASAPGGPEAAPVADQVDGSPVGVAEGDVPGSGAVDLGEASWQVEVFHTSDEMVARMVIDEILGPEGIPAVSHDRRSRALFAPASMPGEIGVAVPQDLAATARELLRQAREDGELDDEDGLIVGPQK